MDETDQSAHQGSSKVVTLHPKSKSKPKSLPGNLDELRAVLLSSEFSDHSTDAEAIADMQTFDERFGFKWKRQSDREAFIHLKNKYGLSDREIRMFYLTGNLKVSANGASLTAYPLSAVGGAILALGTGIVGLFLLVVSIDAVFRNNPYAGRGFLLSLSQLALMGFAIWTQVLPAFAQRRIERRAKLDPLEVEKLVERISKLKG